MDQLPTDQQESLRKTNTERLRLMAARIGDIDEDELTTMDRTALIDKVAKDRLDREEGEEGAVSSRKVEKTDHLREMELQLELKRMELKRTEVEAETRRRELENEREKREHEMRLAQMGRPVETDGDNIAGGNVAENRGEPRPPRVETLADRVKRYGSALKQVVSPMPDDATEIPQFFESLEAMFRTFEVPDDLHAKLLLPFLSTKAKSLISRLCATELEDYEGVRDFLLSEFRLTPREYKAQFDNATKRLDETYIFFAARLRNNLRYYLRSRECLDDFDRLFALLVS